MTLLRRDLVIGGLCAASAALAYVRRPVNPVIAYKGDDATGLFPKRLDGWTQSKTGDFVLPPEDERAAAAVYEDQVSLSYANGTDPPIMFLVAYARSQSSTLMVHRPESCYPGSGFDIASNRAVTLPLTRDVNIPSRILSTVRGDRREQVLYWTRVGDVFPDSWDTERQELARLNLLGYIPDGALIRFSTIDADIPSAAARLAGFARSLYAHCGRDGRALLAGPARVGERLA